MRRERAQVKGQPAVTERGCLLIADISGYTDYLMASPLEFAEDVLSGVTQTVVDSLRRIVSVNKLEGDAVFGYALEGDVDASLLLDTIEECYFAFRAKLLGIEHATTCDCPACTKAPDLNLKFVVHCGSFIRRSTEGREELTGHDVVVVHRLLKNSISEQIGLRAYALFTAACVEALGIDPEGLGLVAHREEYADVGETAAYVEDLERRWRDEREQRPTFVAGGEAAFEIEALFPAEAVTVWHWLTNPGKRMLWQGSRIDEVTAGGRRCTGTTSVCVDGSGEIYEEILDWRPFHYFTERRTLPGAVKLVLTTELEPAAEGTRVRARGLRPPGVGRLRWLTLGPRLERKLSADLERLAALMERPEPRFATATRLPVFSEANQALQ